MRSFWVMAALTVSTVEASSTRGYLAVIGPAPLRLQSIQAVAPAWLPPLAPATPVPVTAPAASPVLSGSPTNTVSGAQTTQQPATNSVPLISPQMLVPFFSEPGASRRDGSGLPPVVFSPALPPAPSSSATFISEPKR